MIRGVDQGWGSGYRSRKSYWVALGAFRIAYADTGKQIAGELVPNSGNHEGQLQEALPSRAPRRVELCCGASRPAQSRKGWVFKLHPLSRVVTLCQQGRSQSHTKPHKSRLRKGTRIHPLPLQQEHTWE